MDVFGLPIVEGALLLGLIGVVLTIALGYFNQSNKVDWKKVGKTGIITFFIAVPLIATQLGAMAQGTEAWQELIIIFGLLAQIAGIDYTIKKSAKLLAKESTTPTRPQ